MQGIRRWWRNARRNTNRWVRRRLRSLFRRTRPPVDGRPKDSYADVEIDRPEKDRFGFPDYARVLVNRAQQAEPPFTIGIFGRWGSGKSSLMRLMRGALEAEKQSPPVETIWINVWQLSNRDEVWQAFLQALFSEVEKKLSLWQRINKWKLLRQLIANSYRIVLVITPMIVGVLLAEPDAGWENVSDFLSNPVGGGSTLVTVGFGLWALIKPIIVAAREVVHFDVQAVLKYAPYEAQISELMRLQQRFEEFVQLAVGKQGRLVVFIDDLDRCTPDKVPEVLEAIKLFTISDRCVYVLGIDHEVVRESIAAKYKFEDEEGGAEYLEKIVQIPFHLPPLDERRVERFVREAYPSLAQEQAAVASVFARGLEPNPRKVKRALNIYRTLQELAEVRVAAWEMDPVDTELLAKMVVIQNRFRPLHEYLVHENEFLLQLECAAKETIEMQELHDPLLYRVVSRGDTSSMEEGLVEEDELPALLALLKTGERFFEDAKDEISTYIHLTGTVEGVAEGLRPSRREREALLGGDPVQVRAQVEDILHRNADEAAQETITKTYRDRLWGVLADQNRYTSEERLSANLALDILDGEERQEFEPEMVRVPAGPFLMGSSDDDRWAQDIEKPQRAVTVPEPYRIGKYPVTVGEFRAFVEAGGYQEERWWTPAGWQVRQQQEWTEPRYWTDEQWTGTPRLPVVGVSWYETWAYTQWLSEATNRTYTLPTEEQWEKAARGTDGRIYPYGNIFDPEKCNSYETGIEQTSEVDRFPAGMSPYGALDMSGNVWEWCLTKWRDNYEAGPENNDPTGDEARVLRGGSFNLNVNSLRAAIRDGDWPGYGYLDFGFRCARLNGP